jgi:hypothetical protein
MWTDKNHAQIVTLQEFIAIVEGSFNATLNPNHPESTARSQCWLFHLKQNAQLWNRSEKKWE